MRDHYCSERYGAKDYSTGLADTVASVTLKTMFFLAVTMLLKTM